MVGRVHLARLKGFTARFLQYLGQRYDGDSGLRPPTILEAQSADQRLWATIFTLTNEKGWTLSDALYEVTEIRSEMASLLQPRPRPPPAIKGTGSKRARIFLRHPSLVQAKARKARALNRARAKALARKATVCLGSRQCKLGVLALSPKP